LRNKVKYLIILLIQE